MASVFPPPVSAVQVGSYFVQQYYHVLQQQPDFVHQFYTDSSTMIRIDGSTTESAAAMLQIHTLIMSLNFTGIEIKTANSLESLSGGVIVMVSGSVIPKDYGGRRKFVQTFFLAPQEKGFYVLNDIFHFLDDEQIHQHQGAILAHSHFDSKVNVPNPLPEAESEYVPAGETHTRDFVASPHVEETDSVDKYSLPEQQQQHYGLPEQQQQQHYGLPEQQQQQHYGLPEQEQQHYGLPEQEQQQHYGLPEQQQHYGLPEQQMQHQVPETNNVVEEAHVDELTTSFSHAMNSVQDFSRVPVPVEESAAEPTKHTYASILRAAKGQSTPTVAPQRYVNKTDPPNSEWHHAPQSTQQFHPASATGYERPAAEGSEDHTAHDEEGEGRSVYVRNLSSSVTALDIEQEFKNFGIIKPEGVIVRNRKDVGVCYAFVEFEDAIGAQNAIKASPVQLAGRQVYIEERRANTAGVSRGRGRGRGRGGYPTEASRGRFGGRSYGRGSGGDALDKDYNRPRGNGYYRRGPTQERGILGNHVMRNGQNAVDEAA